MKCHFKSSNSDWTRFQVLAFWSSPRLRLGLDQIARTWNLVQSSWSDLKCYLIACSKLVDNLGQTVRINTTCWRLVGRLATKCEIFARELKSNLITSKKSPSQAHCCDLLVVLQVLTRSLPLMAIPLTISRHLPVYSCRNCLLLIHCQACIGENKSCWHVCAIT